MNAEGVHDPINLGNPHEFTIRELAEVITELCGTPSSVRYCPLPQDDPCHRQPDISRARHLLSWSPKVELREGLERTIADFEGRLTNPEATPCPRVRAALRRAMEHSNGKTFQEAPALQHSNGKAARAAASVELVGDFEGLGIG
jgi:hypothetical protein